MIVNGVLVEVEARPEHAAELDQILRRVLRIADDETHSEVNLLLRTGEYSYSLVHLFMDADARAAHLAGAASQTIAYSRRLLRDEPRVVDIDLSVTVASLLEEHVGRRDIVVDLRPTATPASASAGR